MYHRLLIPTLVALSLHCSPDYEKVSKHIASILEQHNNLHLGCEFYSLNKRAIIYSSHAHQLFTPASTTKLITSIAALELLGHDYQFKTVLSTDGTITNTTLEGNIYLKGSGDPSLDSSTIEKLFKALSEAGITAISGNLYLDLEDFDEDYFAPGTTVDDIGKFMCPISALMIHRKPIVLSTSATNHLNKDISESFIKGTSFFYELFKSTNISFDGAIGFHKTPKNHTVLATHYSAPLITLIAHLLKHSDNLYADCLFKKMGAELYGSPGTWAQGTKAVASFIDTLAIFSYDMILKDGSGLSRYNLFSPHDIVSLLVWVAEQPYFQEFADSLSIAGIDGTLSQRMLPAASLIKAKTGTLSGVSALSGYLETDDDLLVFSLITNGYTAFPTISSPPKKDIEDAICLFIATHNN